MKLFNNSLLLGALFLGAGGVWAQAPKAGTCPVLPADDIWNTAIDQLPVAPASPAYVGRIGAAATVHADFGSGLWDGAPIGIPFVLVNGAQTKYPATFDYASESDPGPYAVPLNAPIEGGSQSTGDRHAIAIDVDNCVLYELYAAYPQSASWKAGSGAIFNLRSSALRTETWTSADAAGLPIFPGLLRYEEVLAGEIRHAIRFTVPKTLKAYVWPARHYASSITDTSYPPMGARFRLRASFDISSYSPENQVILKAMKKYGLILADNGSAWYISGAPDERWNNDDLHKLGAIKGSDFEAVDVSPLMVNPNSGQARQQSVSVTVEPAAASVALNATRQFSAAVLNSTDQSVDWAVNGKVGGDPVTGWINATGLYTAPNLVPQPAAVTVQATSRSTPSASGTAAVTITGGTVVNVAPVTARVIVGRTRQYTATVLNATNKAVTWQVNGIAGGNATIGTIDATGLYRAPRTVPSPYTVYIRAYSVESPAVYGQATITLARK